MTQTPTDVEAVKAEAQALFDRLTWDEDLRALFRKLPEYAETDATDTFPLKVLADYLRDFGLDWIPDLIQTDTKNFSRSTTEDQEQVRVFVFYGYGVSCNSDNTRLNSVMSVTIRKKDFSPNRVWVSTNEFHFDIRTHSQS